MTHKILVINGPNLEMLGKREKNIYGDFTLKDLEKTITDKSLELNCEVVFFQSNIEGEIINKINSLDESFSGIIINPGGLTHSSISLHDSLEIKSLPKVEVHLSNIYKREEFRRKSVVAPACTSSILGMGLDGYLFALKHIVDNY